MGNTREKLSDVTMATVVPTGKTYFVRDTELPGLAIRVSAGGTASWVVERRVKGRSRRLTLGPDLGASQARKAAKHLLEKMSAGIDPSGGRPERAQQKGPTLRDAIDIYLTERNLEPSTRNDVNNAMAHLSDWWGTGFFQITANDVSERHQLLSERAKGSGARANLVMRYLRAILNHANIRFSDDPGNPLMTNNPVSVFGKMRHWNRSTRRQSYLDSVDLRRVWVSAVNEMSGLRFEHSYRLMFVLSLMTGCRPGEALAVRWKDVDLVKGLVRFRDTKNHSDHTVPLGPFLSDYLKGHMAVVYGEAAEPQDDWPLVALADGSAPASWEGFCERIEKASGIHLLPSDLRRTYITAAESLEIGAYTLKTLLNHAISHDVTRGYMVITSERLVEPQAMIQDRLREMMSPSSGVTDQEQPVKLQEARAA